MSRMSAMRRSVEHMVTSGGGTQTPAPRFQPPESARRTGEASKLNSEEKRGSAPSFTAGQIDAMNRAFKQACARMGLTGDTPVIELVAVRILELAYAGEFDPDKLTATVVAEFGV
jgi:hypothetical protein